MKTSKPPETQVTPPAKKLKQARLPFMLISEESPKSASPQSRKRKLSVPDAEPITKVGKTSKENDMVVISDDESRDGQTTQNEDKPVNPFVKLVDMARKKKLQKSKAPKRKSKRTSKKQADQSVPHTNVNDSADENMLDVEMVEVDVQIHTDQGNEDDRAVQSKITTENEIAVKSNDKSLNIKPSKEQEKSQDTDAVNKMEKPEGIIKSMNTPEQIICLEDSNNSSDIKQVLHLTKTKITEDSTEEIDTLSAANENCKVSPQKCEQKESDLETVESPVTPKRSARNQEKSKDLKSILNTSTSSKLDESTCSEPTTPKTRSSSVTSGDKSMNESATATLNLTPKQLQKKLESAKRKEEKEKERLEREKKRQQEKEDRAKQRHEKDEQKKREREEKEEAKKKEKEEKEDQKKKEREEKEKQKEMEKKLREMKEEQKKKEKEEKEEQRKKEKEAREEEKRKRQEALELEKQEQELKKKKAAEAFVNFFVPKQKVEKDQTIGPISKNHMLSSFAIKSDMRLAPTVRVDLSDEKRDILDQALEGQNLTESALYVKSLTNKQIKPLSSGKTWPLSDKDDDDVMIVEDELPPIDGAGEVLACEPATREKMRPKLLSFHENRRPPYWGTWRKKSVSVKPRRPFGQDEKQLDYEVDSDEEWEEEQEGESLDGSACGSDEEPDAPGDDYEVDNEVFVPHGYLSDEEATMEEDDVLSLTPEAQKAKLKYLEDEFESEMKKPTEKLKPRLYGLLWEVKGGGKPEHCVDALWNYFRKFAMIMNDPTSLLQPSTDPEEVDKKKVKKRKTVAEGKEDSSKTDKKKKAKSENKDKNTKTDTKKTTPNQPGINSFLTKFKAT